MEFEIGIIGESASSSLYWTTVWMNNLFFATEKILLSVKQFLILNEVMQ